ncbi:MAG: hypothetical protein IIW13_02235 [Paludibacteraceae bacterium]|nr:hypothetical protein [Paludibacteraceae bacterium]
MKKFFLMCLCALMLPMAAEAKKEKKPKKVKVSEFSELKLYAQGGRNSNKRGSALSLTQGMVFSLEAADPRDIDVMLFHGKAYGNKQKVFVLFAPENPEINIDWEKDGGTSPYCKFEGKSDDPDAWYALKNWKHRSTTKLEKLPFAQVDFKNITGQQIKDMPIDNGYYVQNVVPGDVILFELCEKSYKPGAKGLIQVVRIEDDETKPEKVGYGPNQRLVLNVKLVK